MKRVMLFLFVVIPMFVFGQDTKKVLIIGVDGCRADALVAANTPNMDLLIANGVFSQDALNDDITVSGPGWSGILTGVRSDKHLVTSNNFSGNDYATYPHFFKYIEDHDPNLNTVSICHWSPINDQIVLTHADTKINVSSDWDVVLEASNVITGSDPDVLFLHFDDVDHAGHSYGYSTTVPQYMSSIETVDNLVGLVMTQIAARPNYANEDWLVISSPDHGGLGFGHGGNSIDEMNTYFIASGNSVATDVIEKDSTIVYDGVFNCLGDNAELTFDQNNDYVQVPHFPGLDFGTSQDFSVECRVRTSLAADVAIVGNKDWDSGSNKGFVFSFKYASGPEWKINIGDGLNRVDINGGSVADNQWHTLTATFDRDGMLRIYEDGVFLDEADMSAIGNIDNAQDLFFGTDIDLDYDFLGSIAETRVWTKVLDPATIANWHCTTIDGSHPDFTDLAGYWQMNEGTGTAINDFSGNNNHGVLNNAIWDDSDSTVVYNYDNTPRLVDVVPTAFNHMCIPVDPLWSLDGISRIENLILGCVDTNACNYYSCAGLDDGTCEYDSCACLGDFTGNNVVNTEDLLIMLGNFDCTGDCIADVNGDLVVDTQDLLLFLGAFGSFCN